jgi:hypothetical protein
MGVSGANDIKSGQFVGTPNQPLGVGMFVKRVETTGVWELIHRSTTANGRWQIDNAVLEAGVWERITSDHPAVTVVSPFSNHSSGLGSFLLRDVVAPTDSDVEVWMPQMPDEVFLSSPLLEATTRAADAMSFSSGDVPSAILSGKWATELTTMHEDSDLATSEVMYLYYLNSTNYLSLTEDGLGSVQAKLATTSGNIVKTVTYSRDQTVTITPDFVSGDLITAGFTTGNGTTSGTVSDWPSATLHVGSDSTPANHIFGRMSEPVPV